MSKYDLDDVRWRRASPLALPSYGQPGLHPHDRREPDFIITDIVLTKSDAHEFLQSIHGETAARAVCSLYDARKGEVLYLHGADAPAPAPVPAAAKRAPYSELAKAVEHVLRQDHPYPNFSISL